MIFDPLWRRGLPLFIEEGARFGPDVFGERLSFLSERTRVRWSFMRLIGQLSDIIIGSTVEFWYSEDRQLLQVIWHVIDPHELWQLREVSLEKPFCRIELRTMDDGRWTMDDERWTMNDEREIDVLLRFVYHSSFVTYVMFVWSSFVRRSIYDHMNDYKNLEDELGPAQLIVWWTMNDGHKVQDFILGQESFVVRY